MSGTIKGLLLIEGLDLGRLVEDYRLFFLGLLPSMFVLAVLFEFLSDLNPFSLVKRAFISVLILSSVSTFYHSSISASIDAAESILDESKAHNILLMDMFEGGKYLDQLNTKEAGKDFLKDESIIRGAYAFLKYQLFDGFVNDGLTVVIFFITKLCFLILKVVYSLVYYLGLGLIGIPCLLYLFPGMSGVLKGGIVSFVWCLIVPHILVFILTIIGSEINRGYMTGQIIGGSIMGTALLFILTLFIAFTPLIAGMILSGSGASAAGGIIATLGANYVMSLPSTVINLAAHKLGGGELGGTGPKMKLATAAAGKTYRFAKNSFSSGMQGKKANEGQTEGQSPKQSKTPHAGRDHGKSSQAHEQPESRPSNMGPVDGPKKSGIPAQNRESDANRQNLNSASQRGPLNNDVKGGRHPAQGMPNFPRSPSHMSPENQNNRRNEHGTVPELRPSNRAHQTPNHLDRGNRDRPPVRASDSQHHGGPNKR